MAALQPLSRNDGAHFLLHGRAHDLIQIALVTFQIDRTHNRGLGRQLLCDFVLAPAQHEGANTSGQQVPAHRVTALLYRCAPPLGEVLLASQKAWQQKVKQGPQFTKMVFQRRAGQAQAVARLQFANGHRSFGVRVLDKLRLIQDQQVVTVLAQEGLVSPKQGVGRDHQIVLANLLEAFLAGIAMQAEHPKTGGEASGLLAPVVHKRRRHHNERRPVQSERFLLHQHVRQRLHGLAKAHVVGQHAAQVVLAQKLHPVQSLVLVAAQGCRQGKRQRHLAHAWASL